MGLRANVQALPVLNLVGIHAAAAITDETVTFNGRQRRTGSKFSELREECEEERKVYVRIDITIITMTRMIEFNFK